MIVDTHVHVISEDQQRYPRKAGELPEWVQDLSGETLIALNREAGIDRTALVQGFGAYEFDNSYAADCGVQHPDHFTCVCIVDQLQKDAPDKLTYWVKQRGVRGVRLFTITEPEVSVDDPRAFPLWERATELGIPVCIMTRFHQVPRLPAVLECFPDVPVALDHVAVPRLREGPPYDSLKPLFELSRFPNLYLKFSSETIYAARRDKSTPREFFRRLVEHFSPKRIMWGSNFPATHDRGLNEQLEMAREELSFLPEEDQRWLFGQTALTLWPMLR
jgi:predicted TIM-barrel fold metal-dependent hydrolase